jgi:hypothetical protein
VVAGDFSALSGLSKMKQGLRDQSPIPSSPILLFKEKPIACAIDTGRDACAIEKHK